MKALKIIFVVFVTLSAGIVAGFLGVNYFKPKPSGILINTSPTANVYINGSLVGKTPFQSTAFAGNIDLKLSPVITDQNLSSYETKVALVSGIQTVVRREFGTMEDLSSGDVISFQKVDGDSASLVVISTPDNSQVLIDNIVQGFTPYNYSSISIAPHIITVKAQGYLDRNMSIKTLAGYQLTVFAKLAKAPVAAATPTPSPTAQPAAKTYVVIGNTPTGYLNMRSEAKTAGSEIAQLKPGDKYLYLQTDATSGWYKIQYQPAAAGLPNGITGWVSNQYSSLATQSASLANP